MVLYIIYHQVLEEEVVEAYRRMVDGLEVWRQQDVYFRGSAKLALSVNLWRM